MGDTNDQGADRGQQLGTPSATPVAPKDQPPSIGEGVDTADSITLSTDTTPQRLAHADVDAVNTPLSLASTATSFAFGTAGPATHIPFNFGFTGPTAQPADPTIATTTAPAGLNAHAGQADGGAIVTPAPLASAVTPLIVGIPLRAPGTPNLGSLTQSDVLYTVVFAHTRSRTAVFGLEAAKLATFINAASGHPHGIAPIAFVWNPAAGKSLASHQASAAVRLDALSERRVVSVLERTASQLTERREILLKLQAKVDPVTSVVETWTETVERYRSLAQRADMRLTHVNNIEMDDDGLVSLGQIAASFSQVRSATRSVHRSSWLYRKLSPLSNKYSQLKRGFTNTVRTGGDVDQVVDDFICAEPGLYAVFRHGAFLDDSDDSNRHNNEALDDDDDDSEINNGEDHIAKPPSTESAGNKKCDSSLDALANQSVESKGDCHGPDPQLQTYDKLATAEQDGFEGYTTRLDDDVGTVTHVSGIEYGSGQSRASPGEGASNDMTGTTIVESDGNKMHVYTEVAGGAIDQGETDSAMTGEAGFDGE